MVIATHDLRLAAGIAHEVVFLEAGEVVEKGEAARVFFSARARAHPALHRLPAAGTAPMQRKRAPDEPAPLEVEFGSAQ